MLQDAQCSFCLVSPQPPHIQHQVIDPSQASGTLLSSLLQRVREGTPWGYGTRVSLSCATGMSGVKLLGCSFKEK